MRFPYRQYISPIAETPEEFRLILRPVIPVTIHGAKSKVTWDALLDTGADETLVPEAVAEIVDVRWMEDEFDQVAGLGGRMFQARYGELTFEISDDGNSFRWSAIVGFVDFEEAREAPLIFGHEGCLELFTATFDGDAAEVELIPNELADGVKDR